ncbi:hypothetical protein CXK93_21345 [Stutzerimonas decontaminans]|jgi:hypothetical protein|uniref:Secreted protein n=2 Tax=Stutzerimonas TaxID=2901164 RepID=A0ABX4VRS6_9GAMM|nr:hypothetical protein [Stutzerimonas decontaminans]AHY43393.1 hypothetical protein UIB01_13265 [Stutzerimonas decontaminans]MCQ4247007.1 hypothetical protein [Stutzerimonas decontaminans]MCW8157620.1 hypothetical protein [Stutzerimonas stutzeri]PNF82877.1 hypothetical protein CXK93_21345 [Stutzerimonas decontaminans]
MNTVKQWMRATRALGFALVLATDPACAALIVESLSADPTSSLHDSHVSACEAANSPSVIAYSQSTIDPAQRCAMPSSDQRADQPAIIRGHRTAEPAAGAQWFPATDSRRYSF